MIRTTRQQSTWFWLWLLCGLFILGSHPHWLSDTVRIVPAAAASLTAPTSIWLVPLSRIPDADTWSTWWYVLFAGAAAVVITTICHGPDRACSFDRLLAAVGLSLLVRQGDLWCAAALALLATFWTSPASNPRAPSSGWLIGVIAGLAVLGTLEFGLVLLFSIVVLTTIALDNPQDSKARWRSWAPLMLFTAGTAVAGIGLPGFVPAALRPINWLWLRPVDDLMPSLSSVGSSPVHLAALALIAPFCGRCGWSALQNNRNLLRPGMLAVCLFLAFACQRYCFLASLAWMSTFPELPAGGFRLSRPRVVWATVLIVAVGRAGWVADFSPLASPLPVARRIEPRSWETAGPVILLDLDQSREWQSAELARRFPLVVDDRWDATGSRYADYAALCRDLREVRIHSYLRSDGQWGGYKRRLQAWNPTLVVVESTDVEAIRGLSLSPDWRIMGIDGVRTIFGRADEPTNLPQMQHALQCLVTLEWPAQLSGFSLENTIVAGDIGDDRTVAGALCALRFPYAALRFVRQDRSVESKRLRASCHLELAHRVAAHASTGSLLDQFRAIVGARAAIRHLPRNSTQRLWMTRGIQGLETRFESGSDDSLATDEQHLRAALLTGRVEDVAPRLDRLSEPLRSYYGALADALQRTPPEICSSLQVAIAGFDDRIPADTKSEAQFYLGCAAIEAGDSLLAVAALEASANWSPDHPFREIRNVYLRYLRR